MKCPQCGKENSYNALFCNHCGHSLTSDTEPQQTDQIAQTQPTQPVYQKTFNRKYLFLGVIILLAIGGFMLWNNLSNGPKEAQSVADLFYTDLKNNDLGSASKLYHVKFLQTTSLENVTVFINSVNSKIGPITAYNCVNSNVFSVSGSPSYSRVTLIYEITRTGYNSRETLILLKDDTNTQFQIASWNIQSSGLLTP
jgi:hypothetical protein